MSSRISRLYKISKDALSLNKPGVQLAFKHSDMTTMRRRIAMSCTMNSGSYGCLMKTVHFLVPMDRTIEWRENVKDESQMELRQVLYLPSIDYTTFKLYSVFADRYYGDRYFNEVSVDNATVMRVKGNVATEYVYGNPIQIWNGHWSDMVLHTNRTPCLEPIVNAYVLHV